MPDDTAHRAGTGATVPAMQLHLLDATFELFRAFYPRPNGPAGGEGRATVGSGSSLLALLHDAP